jgi:UPF0716 family protein affecting phage T7 exclusion
MIFLTLFCLVFLVEISVFLAFVDRFGLFLGFLEILVTLVLGLRLISSRPLVVIQQLQQELAAGGDPREIIFGGLRLFIAGFFLIMPGLVSDMIGIWLWLASLLGGKPAASNRSEWANNGDSPEVRPHDFDDAWHGDEFSERIKGRSSPVDAGDIVDATIISTDDKTNPKKD